MIKELIEDNLKEIVQSNSKVVVQYGASWCGACKIMKPKLKKASESNEDITFIYADAENFLESRSLTVIQNLPTFVGFVNGEVVAKEVGSKVENLNKLVDAVANH